LSSESTNLLMVAECEICSAPNNHQMTIPRAYTYPLVFAAAETGLFPRVT